MPELAVGRDLLAALTTLARDQGLRRIRHAHVAVGTGCDLDALRRWFEVASPGSIAEGAQLQIEPRFFEAYCFACRREVAIRRRSDTCPECGSYRLRVGLVPGVTVLACDGDG